MNPDDVPGSFFVNFAFNQTGVSSANGTQSRYTPESEQFSPATPGSADVSGDFEIVVADIFNGFTYHSSDKPQKWISADESLSRNIRFLWSFLGFAAQLTASPGGTICLFAAKSSWYRNQVNPAARTP